MAIRHQNEITYEIPWETKPVRGQGIRYGYSVKILRNSLRKKRRFCGCEHCNSIEKKFRHTENGTVRRRAQ